MIYIKEAFTYMRRKFFALILYTLVPASILAAVSNPATIFEFLAKGFISDKKFSFWEVLKNTTELDNPKTVSFMLLGSFVMALCLSALSGILERDMRLGLFSHRGFFKHINRHFIPIFLIILTFLVIMETYGVLNAIFLYFFRTILFKEIYAALALSIVTVILFSIGLFIVFSKLFVALPHRVMSSANIFLSFAYSWRASRKKVLNIAIAIFLPITPLYIYTYLQTAYFNYIAIRYISNLIIYSICILYFVILMYVVYFDAFDIPREDKKETIWSRGKKW